MIKLARARTVLGLTLNLTVEERERLEVASRLQRLRSAVRPPVDELVALALVVRPDLAALRLGEKHALAHLAAARTVPLSDFHLLYNPYTFANAPAALEPGASFALGVTVPNVSRTEGNIARARINLQQSRSQTTLMEAQVADDVKRAHLDCELFENELSRTESGTLARAAQIRDAAELDYLAQSQTGESKATTRLDVVLRDWSEYEKVEHRYVEILVRHLSSALDLNTAVGERVMP